MDRLFLRIATTGAIVAIVAAGALSGTYAKTGTLSPVSRGPQPSSATLVTPRSPSAGSVPATLSLGDNQADEPLGIVDKLPDARSTAAKNHLANRRPDHQQAASASESPLFSRKAIDIGQMRMSDQKPEIASRSSSSNNGQEHHSSSSNHSLIFSERKLPEFSESKPPEPVAPRALQPQRKSWLLTAAPDLTPRDSLDRAGKPVLPGKRPMATTIESDVRHNPTPVPANAATPVNRAETKPARLESNLTAGKSLSAAKAVQPNQLADEPTVRPQPAKKALLPRTEERRVTKQRVVSKPHTSKPPRPMAAISKQRFQLVARISREHIAYGMDLANRGAVRSARQEFIAVLNRVSQALDYTTGNHQYTQALNEGLTALREAEDFQTGDTKLSTDLDMQHLVATHQTTVLKGSDKIQRLTPVMAMQMYLEYAKQRLVFASGGQQVTSQALYGLARLETLQAQGRPLDKPIRGPRAIALHQAALMVDQNNYAAANELGVLLARYGQLDSAGDILRHAAKTAPRAETWHNLTRVYELKGANQEADYARTMFHRLRAESLKSPTAKNENRQVYWVAPQVFGSHGNSIGTDLPRNPAQYEPSKASQNSESGSGWSKPPHAPKGEKTGRGALHHLGRFIRGKTETRSHHAK